MECVLANQALHDVNGTLDEVKQHRHDVCNSKSICDSNRECFRISIEK